VLAPAFYALGRPRIPLMASGAAVASNMAAVFLLHPFFGHGGVAVGLVVSTFVNVLVLGTVLRGAVGPFGGADVTGFCARVIGSAAVMGIVAALAAYGLEVWLGPQGMAARTLTALVPIGLGAAVYFGLTTLLRVPEAHGLRDALRRRRG
jgi:putative peptidoglycan lipid II flippase